jgi:hypothetical protein
MSSQRFRTQSSSMSETADLRFFTKTNGPRIIHIAAWEIILVLILALPAARAAMLGPYQVDSDTVHLFHLDQASGSSTSINAVPGARPAIAFDGATLLNHSSNPQPAATNVLGQATGPPSFGNAASIATASAAIGLDANLSGGFQAGTATICPDSIAHSTLTGSGGAFTLEALVQPISITGTNRQILSTDSTLAGRGFHFRIGMSGRLEFNFIATAAPAVSAAIPIAGPHAFVPGNWYHAAYTYDGTVSRFYWTLASSGATSANFIGQSSDETTTGTVTGPLVIGNEARLIGNSSEGLVGLIDEVRISRRARLPTEFLFGSFDLATDLDADQLPDAWELLFANSLSILSGLNGADHDLDGASDLAEFNSESNPANPASTPSDTDADGLADDWERSYFGGLAYHGTSDPDADGENNNTERSNASAPNNSASHSSDTDADGLPDVWENIHFNHLTSNAGDDPDGDRFSNFQEHLASTLPGDLLSRPTGTAVKLVPIDDGDHATSEFGFAGASAINTVSFVRSSLKTIGNQQFVTWYGRHQLAASAPFNNTIWIGRRTLGSSTWEVFRHATFTANDINDGHDVISYGIDGDGFMHLSWGMHGDGFHYSRSTTPVTGTGPIVLGPDTTMTGQEDIVTYPQFLKLPGGDLLFLFRRFWSGNGAQFLIRYSIADKTWRNVHQSAGGAQQPFMSGMWAPANDYNAYVNMPQLGGIDGDDLILTFNWRYLPVNAPGAPGSPGGFSGYQTNNRLNFARSPDAGVTWQRSDHTPYSLPITRNGEAGPASTAEVINQIPEGSSLINQAGMCLDGNGNPVTATWWAPETASGNFRRQYMIVFRHDNGTWQTRPVSNRTLDPTTTRYSESAVRNLGRPIVVNDDQDRIIIAYRDNANTNGITIVHSLPKAQDPDRSVWIEFDLTTENLGNFEPIIDNELWDSDRQLHFLHQPSGGEGYSPPANNAARISVLEWDADSYFSQNPQPRLSFTGAGTQVVIAHPSQPSWSYRLWSSDNLEDWQPVETRVGTGGDLVFVHSIPPGETKRFWRVESAEGGF